MMLAEHISNIVKPLVLSGIYKNEEVALKEIIRDHVLRKTQKYKHVISEFQAKYKLSFEEFSEKIKNKATVAEEDDWMDWKAAIEMSETWNNVANMIL